MSDLARPLVITDQPRQHSGLGASGMSRWMACPGSYGLTARNRASLPPRRPRRASVHAAKGTVAHWLVEQALLDGLEPERYLDAVMDCDGYQVRLDDELLQGVSVMTDYVRRARGEYAEMFVELLVALDSYFPAVARPPEPMYTYADVLLVGPRRIEIIDYKNGAGVFVSVLDNPQLLYGAAGALLALGDAYPAENIRLTIVQPNARGIGEKIRSWDLTALDVLMWVDEVLIPAVDAVRDPDAPLHLGDHCRFCPAAELCPALRAAGVEAARRDFDPIQDLAALGDELNLADVAELWIAATRERAERHLRAGHEIPGWALVPKRAVRSWTDPGEVARVLNAQNEDTSHFYKTQLVSPAQAEKLAGERLKRLLKPFVERVSPGDKLGRVNRPEPFDPLEE